MRVATIRHEGSTTAARVDGEHATTLPFEDVRALLESGPDWAERAAAAEGRRLDVSALDFAPLVPSPEKIFCVGLNYKDHADEANVPLAEYPVLFAKFSRALIGANDDIVLPADSAQPDWEIELGLVIGTAVRNADLEEARAAIAGYTVINDVTMRDWQLRTTQYLSGKTFEATTPVGPYLVTLDEIDDPDALDLSCSVDDVTMQSSNTRHLVYSPAEVISYISTIITLVPGDIIATGTSGGVGLLQKPPVFLKEGNVLRSTVQGLGEQRNRCVSDGRTGAAAGAVGRTAA